LPFTRLAAQGRTIRTAGGKQITHPRSVRADRDSDPATAQAVKRAALGH